MIGRIGVFSASGYDLISSPLINSVLYLAQRGYEVDLFCVQSDKFPLPRFDTPRARSIPWNLDQLPGGKLRRFEMLRSSLLATRGRSYDFAIGFDPPGLWLAAQFALFRPMPLVYHSLEIVSADTLRTKQQKVRKWLERQISKRCILSITQHELRASVLARENGLARDRIAIVPNSSLGKPILQGSQWLRERFSIGSDKVIVLGVGSLIPQHCIEQLVSSVPEWPESFVLVLHGWFADHDFEQRIRAVVASTSQRVFISTDLLPIAEKYTIFQSADVGVVLFDPAADVNFKLGGVSAGKLFDFFRCGVPVIVNDLPGVRGLVQDSGSGLVIGGFEGLGLALVQIEERRAEHRRAAIRTFEENEFSRCYEPVLQRLERICRAKGRLLD